MRAAVPPSPRPSPPPRRVPRLLWLLSCQGVGLALPQTGKQYRPCRRAWRKNFCIAGWAGAAYYDCRGAAVFLRRNLKSPLALLLGGNLCVAPVFFTAVASRPGGPQSIGAGIVEGRRGRDRDCACACATFADKGILRLRFPDLGCRGATSRGMASARRHCAVTRRDSPAQG